MADNETSPFGEYYITRQTTWVYCFKKNCGINTNPRIPARIPAQGSQILISTWTKKQTS